jgi:hypothetical protein
LKKNNPICTQPIFTIAPPCDVLLIRQYGPFSLIQQDKIVACAFPFPKIEMHDNEGSPSGLRYLYAVL